MCLDTSYDMGSMAHDDVGPSHTFAHRDTSRSHPHPLLHLCCPPLIRLPTDYPTAPVDVCGRDEMRFMPTPSAVPLSLCISSSSRQNTHHPPTRGFTH
ncbi:hypothetical protein CFP56_000958 [Quercus suber]|uniref:Uncharacterized protein n=1 Tax=Quercus suber TaxID=58331 RepID=A0AAW0INY3_QUESU